MNVICERELSLIMPTCDSRKWIAALNATMSEFEITGTRRPAAFLANIAVETQELNRLVENLNYSARRLYELFPRTDSRRWGFRDLVEAMHYERRPVAIANRIYGGRLGNGLEDSGDGWKYRGRSAAQLTGRANYVTCGKFLGLNLADDPDLILASPSVCCRVAGWHWAENAAGNRDMNVLADNDQLIEVRKGWNGGTIGFPEVSHYYKKALAILQT